MTVCFFIHSKSKRAKSIALVDSGATENFMNLKYVKYLKLPIKRLPEPWKLFNIDGTTNWDRELQFFTDLQAQTGTQHTNLCFFFSNLGENKAILGYPWFMAVQPQINWKKGWIDHTQLPIILRAPDATKACFILRQVNKPRREHVQYYIGQVAIYPEDPTQKQDNDTEDQSNIPPQYCKYSWVFSEEALHEFPPSRIWDHTIELKPGTPASLPGKLIPLSQAELKELQKFILEHLKHGTIRLLKSPYMASFFFIKKKNGKLRPVQDYCPVNQWTIQNKYPLPLIPQLVDWLWGCSLYTKFDIQWGYNNVHIKEGDEWKVAFLTNQGLYEPMVMFFRLTNSLATFQTMINSIFTQEMAESWLTIYMDDMAIHTQKGEEELEQTHRQWHQHLVRRVLQKLQQHNLFLKPEKCTFEQPSIEFLGVCVDQGMVQMDDTKIEKVKNWKTPFNVREVQKFLGFMGYYWYFI